MIYFRTIWGAKEPQNLPNHRVVITWSEMAKIVRGHEKLKRPQEWLSLSILGKVVGVCPWDSIATVKTRGVDSYNYH